MSMELYNGKKPCCSTLSCHDLDTSDGLPVFCGTAVINVLYLIQQGVCQNQIPAPFKIRK